MSRGDTPEDLLVLARQSKRGAEEERRFELAVNASRELELLYTAGREFDTQASLLLGDETRVSLLVERTLNRLDQAAGAAKPPHLVARSGRAALAARYFAASLAVGLLLSVALARAWDYVEKRRAQEHAEPRTSTSAAHSEAKPSARVATPLAPLSLPPFASVNASTPTIGRSAAQRALPASRPSSPKGQASDGNLDASQLFARANEARREGDLEDAISLYERLSSQYPSSVEAQDAKVLIGNLLLSQRSPRAALRQFEGYGSEPLALEALWGRAQALRRLASADEGTVLQELVRDYPDSPYAESARKRRRELSP